MKLERRHIILYYLILYLSLLVGFYYGEDFAGGFEYDLQTHKMLLDNLFNKNLSYGLLNYDIFYVPHSPIFIIYLLFLKKIFLVEEVYRLVNLHFSLLLPFFVGLSLKVKLRLKKNDIRYLLPSIFIFSPYFRAGSIWTDDNLLAMVFLSISIYFFVKHEKDKDNIKNVIISAFFLAISAYFRPIYSILSIYFFLNFFLNLKISKKLLFYILLNFFLAIPAFYYIFILEINKWAISYLFRENIFTILSISSSIIVFYFLPFIIRDYKSILKQILNKNNYLFCLIILSFVIYFFEYDRSYSGGIVLKFSNLFFGNNYFFYLISSVSILLLYSIFFSKNKERNFFDLILLITLFVLEIDGVIYHETYDPLIYVVILLLLKNKFFTNYIKKFNMGSFSILIIFLSFFYFTAVMKTIGIN
tara:strand:+ start:962 stop:2209 length:1248 start_codon:yes stop_codon:yes gene_type:complete